MTMKRFFHWSLALLLLPILWAVLHETVMMVPTVTSEGFQMWWLYVGGAVVYVAIERLFTKPMSLYVIGHELTHALTGFLSGAKIHSIKASAKGGEVRLSKSNIFVALSPYIVPLYALVLIALYALVRIWYQRPPLVYFFQFMLGATLAFHWSMTYAAIHKKQPDLKIIGVFLSTVLILIGNTLILGVFCVSLFRKTPSLKIYTHRLGQESLHAWRWTAKTGISAGRWVVRFAEHEGLLKKWTH